VLSTVGSAFGADLTIFSGAGLIKPMVFAATGTVHP
jgi:hypothetical protein